MRRSARLAPLAPALALVASCATNAPEEDAPEQEPEVEDTWEAREPESHASPQPRLLIADDEGGQVQVMDVHSGDVLDTFDVDDFVEFTSVDPEGSQVVLNDGALLETGIHWEPHGGHYDPANEDPELVTDDGEISEAQDAADDPFDAEAVQAVEGSTITVHPPEGDEVSVDLPEDVAAAVWDPYWEQALALTVDGTLHTIDPEAGEVSGSESVTDEVNGPAAIAPAESHVYVSNAATKSITEVGVSRDGLEPDRVRVLDIAPSGLLAVGMEPLDRESHDDDHDHEHDHEHDDDHDDHDHDHDDEDHEHDDEDDHDH